MTERKQSPEEKLLAAIGEIDDRFIKEAAEPYNPGLSLRRLGSIAASIALVSVIALGAAKILPAFEPSYDAGAPEYNGEEEPWIVTSERLYYDGSVLKVDDIVGGRLRLTLNVYNPLSDFVISIRGKDKDGRNIIFTTGEDAPEGYIRKAVKIMINGVDANALPTDAGTYTIVIDLSDAQADDYEMKNEIEAGVFGKIMIEK